MANIYAQVEDVGHITGSATRYSVPNLEYRDIELRVDEHTYVRWGFVRAARADEIVTALESAVASMRAQLALASQPEPGALDVAEVGDVLPREVGPPCLAPVKRIGYPCMRRRYHSGQHVAQDPKGRVLAVRPVDAEAVAS